MFAGDQSDRKQVPVTKPLREGSPGKRRAILAAAHELFLRDGFDRTSVDAVAALAKVSKRTVYDYFGDKDTLLVAVFEDASTTVIGLLHDAIHRELGEITDIEADLVRFSLAIAASPISSPWYALLRLVMLESPRLPELNRHWIGHRIASAPEEAVAARLGQLGRDGLLDVADPVLAAEHLASLTQESIFIQSRFGARPLPPDVLEHKIREGVRAFLRAYRAERRSETGASGRPSPRPASLP